MKKAIYEKKRHQFFLKKRDQKEIENERERERERYL